MKLAEALSLNECAQKPLVDVVKLGRSRAMRAQFNGYARYLNAASKGAERPDGRRNEQSQQDSPRSSSADQAPSSRPSDMREDAQDSAFMNRLRARADQLVMGGRDREREQDRD